MRHLKRFFFLVAILVAASIGHAQAPRVPDCITGSDGSCRALAKHQVSGTNAANTVTITAPNVPRTLALTSTCSAGMAAVTVSVSTASDFSNPLTIDTLTAATTVTKQYDATTLGGTTLVSPLVFP